MVYLSVSATCPYWQGDMPDKRGQQGKQERKLAEAAHGQARSCIMEDVTPRERWRFFSGLPAVPVPVKLERCEQSLKIHGRCRYKAL
jgi:hypothetical protein